MGGAGARERGGGRVSECVFTKNPNLKKIVYGFFLTSPEHIVLMVSYCDQSLSVVRAMSTFCFKRLLLQNG